MSHKVHPKSFRIRGIEDWNVRGFYGKQMPQFLEEDFLIKDFLRKKLKDASVANIQQVLVSTVVSGSPLHKVITKAMP
jgi:small subunit ribosomal protein S3